MLSFEEERDIERQNFYKRWGHYPDESLCSHCNQPQKTITMTRMGDVFTDDFMNTLPYHWRDWLMCDDCSGRPNMRKSFSKPIRCDGKPIQLSLQFPDVDGSSISKPRS